MKKKISIALFLNLLATICSAQEIKFNYSKYINNIWGKWEEASSFEIKGDINDFIIYENYDHPSNYIMRIKIDNYVAPNKKTKKITLKENKWYEYSGTVEYFTSDYSAQYFKFDIKNWPYFSLSANDSHAKSNIKKAIIKIAPYKDNPQCFNIYFDNIGIAISIK